MAFRGPREVQLLKDHGGVVESPSIECFHYSVEEGGGGVRTGHRLRDVRC